MNELLKYTAKAEQLTAFSDEVFTKHVDRVIIVSRKEVGFVMKCGPVFREGYETMEHTPFGYVIVDGRPKVHEMEAARLTTLYSSYLLGLSRESAAEVAGIKANHTEVKRMLQNVHYLGDDVYPRIIDDDILMPCRLNGSGGRRHSAETTFRRRKTRSRNIYGVQNEKATKKITDPIAQAEYAYSRIEGKVNE